MITDSFDNKTEPIFTLKDFYGERKKILDICIIIFPKRFTRLFSPHIFVQRLQKSMHRTGLFRFINSALKERKLLFIYQQSVLPEPLSIVSSQTG